MPQLTRMGLRLPLILCATTLLSGCVLPEVLDADISMNGYKYSVAMKGRVAEPRMVGALAKGQEIPANVDEKMKAEAAKARELPGMTEFVYVGEGRFDFTMEANGELTTEKSSIGLPNTTSNGRNNLLQIKMEDDGTVVISTPEVPAKAVQQITDVGLQAKGTVRISVTGNVIESNADVLETGNTYIWNRDSWEDRVFIKFDPNGK